MYVRCSIRGAACMCLAVLAVAAPLSAEDLSLRQALETTLSGNPTVSAARLSAEAAGHAAKSARALTNPEIIVAPSVVGEAGADSALLFSQPLEINGSRLVRGRIASHQEAAARSDAEASARDATFRVSETYWDVVRAQELVKLNEENVLYIETVRAAVQKQYDIGAAPGAQTIKMDVELARARQELAQAQLDLSQAKSTLNTLANRPAGADFTASDPLALPGSVPDPAALRAAALAHRPEIASAQAQLAASEGEIKAARIRRMPDLALQARRESFDRDSDSGVAIVVTLPFVDWGSAKSDCRRAEAETRSQEKRLEAARSAVLLDVEHALQRIDTSARVAREFQGGILEKSEQLASMARKGYEKGANSYLEVLEAQRTLRSTRSACYFALAEHAKARAQLEWAAGCPLASIAATEVSK